METRMTTDSETPDLGRQPDPVLTPPSAAVAARMSRHPRRDTGPELTLRKALHAAGYRYRVQLPVPGRRRRTVDVAFTRRKVAVFVDGCFWHGCAEHRGVPATNSEWWRRKLEKNVARDADTDEHLRRLGWVVIRVWEHETAEAALGRIEAALNRVTDAS
jgi:DNA mismatch endonuclease (patch repair protein)